MRPRLSLHACRTRSNQYDGRRLGGQPRKNRRGLPAAGRLGRRTGRLSGAGPVQLPSARPSVQAAVRRGHRGLARGGLRGHRRGAGPHRHDRAKSHRAGPTLLQFRRLLPPRQGGGDGEEVPASHLRCLRRGQVLRAGKPPDGDRSRGQAHRCHDLRGYLDPPDGEYPAPVQWPRSGPAARDGEVRPDGEPLREPVAQREVGHPEHARHRRREAARLPRGLRKRRGRERRAHLRRPEHDLRGERQPHRRARGVQGRPEGHRHPRHGHPHRPQFCPGGDEGHLRGARPRPQGLRAQERVQEGARRPLGGNRLRARRRDRGRGLRTLQRPWHFPAVDHLLAAFAR